MNDCVLFQCVSARVSHFEPANSLVTCSAGWPSHTVQAVQHVCALLAPLNDRHVSSPDTVRSAFIRSSEPRTYSCVPAVTRIAIITM